MMYISCMILSAALFVAFIMGNRGNDWSYAPETLGNGPQIYESQLSDLVDFGDDVVVLEKGFKWAEGPVWVNDGNYLLFSDVKYNTIYKWSDVSGLSVWLRPSGLSEDHNTTHPLLEPGSNGLAVDPVSGYIVVCDHGNRRLYMVDREGKHKSVIVASYDGKRFNSPNDLVFSVEGDLLFSDPSYGLQRRGAPGVMETSHEREHDVNGVYRVPASAVAAAAVVVSSAGAESVEQTAVRLAMADSMTERVIDTMHRPNGLGFSRDGSRLIVSCSCRGDPHWMEFDVEHVAASGDAPASVRVLSGSAGSGSGGRRLEPASSAAALMQTKDGLVGNPDGFVVDPSNGVMYATGPGGVVVLAEDGRVLGAVRTGVKTGNCALGGDGYLYMTADAYLARTRLHEN